MRELIGRKVGMTRLFDEDGTATPVTVISAGPCVVVAQRTQDVDGHNALAVGYEVAKAKHVSKPRAGQFKKANIEPTRVLSEVAVPPKFDGKPGDQLTVEMFQVGEFVDVSGVSIGKGQQGIVFVVNDVSWSTQRGKKGSNFRKVSAQFYNLVSKSRVCRHSCNRSINRSCLSTDKHLRGEGRIAPSDVPYVNFVNLTGTLSQTQVHSISDTLQVCIADTRPDQWRTGTYCFLVCRNRLRLCHATASLWHPVGCQDLSRLG